MVDVKEIEYIERMNHLLGCVCSVGDSEFIIGVVDKFSDCLWNCYDLKSCDFCALEDLTFFDEDGNVIGDYSAYTLKYYGIKID